MSELDDTAGPAETPAPTVYGTRVWDLPTRLAHWLFVAGVAFSWWTAETGRLEWHRWSGYSLLGLVVFRLYWGFVGGSTARFANFVRGPRAVVAYLRGNGVAAIGHNPLGALSVLALLGLLLLQIALGLFAVDVDGIESGPLSLYVSFEAGRVAAKWHDIVFNALLGLIVLHVVAVLYYFVLKRQNLIGTMITGKRVYETAMEPMSPASALKLVIGAVVATVITWTISKAFQF
ncbi:MAG TPA: cytochrome b/b6 domain-containing protein [Steroidobacteraceae bacterium]|nr:cytochrome b/b6 domain-containing protein [Steroidobacteraceae bacterium]